MTKTNHHEINKSLQELILNTEPNDDAGRELIDARAAIEAVRLEVANWQGVTTHEHRFGGIEFRLGHRELGHLHRSIADLPYPRRLRDELVAAGRARPHHVLPNSGWVTVPMRTAPEVVGVIELFRQNYERALSDRR
jgi:hypothetical protein